MEFGHRSAVRDVPLLNGDVGNPKAVEEAVERFGVDALIHFGAYKSHAESMLKPQRYFANNVARSAALLETLHGAGMGRLVFSSTRALYGTPERFPVERTPPSTRRAPTGRARP